MVAITLITPLDQPTGQSRLLTALRAGIADPKFASLQMMVAFAKSGPLLRLEAAIIARKAAGFRIEAIIGIDQFGTSAQALKFALDNFDAVYVTREPGRTFHPKIYLFEGDNDARAFVGSNNLTVGGTETNFESSMRVDLNLPADEATYAPFRTMWEELLPGACPATFALTPALLQDLMDQGVVPDERTMRTTAAANGGAPGIPRPTRSGLAVKPPSALPAKAGGKKKAATATPAAAPAAAPNVAALDPQTAQGFAIQIKPHKNGEIFLSVTAALQNPDFFKWPFTGTTAPKANSNNPGYPQLVPDPIVNFTVYGAAPAPLLTLTNYALNTVYYAKNSEIRITASPLVSVVPEYSVMIMHKGNVAGTDYEIIIHTPDSPDYQPWVEVCNQKMPGGGKAPRKFGWF